MNTNTANLNLIRKTQGRIDRFLDDDLEEMERLNLRIMKNRSDSEKYAKQQKAVSEAQANRVIKYHAQMRKKQLHESRPGWFAMVIALIDIVVAVGAILYGAHVSGMISMEVACAIAVVTDTACALGIIHLIRKIRGK